MTKNAEGVYNKLFVALANTNKPERMRKDEEKDFCGDAGSGCNRDVALRLRKEE